MTAPFTEIPTAVRKRLWAELKIECLNTAIDVLSNESRWDSEFMTTAMRGANHIAVKDIEIIVAMVRQQLQKAYAESGVNDE